MPLNPPISQYDPAKGQFHMGTHRLRPGPDRHRFYIAAPFFNPEQVLLVKSIEAACASAGHEWFSPRLQKGEGPAPKPKNRVEAMTLFDMNVRGMEWADAMLAVVDYKLPKAQTLRVCAVNEHRDTVPMSFPLAMPDVGVTFEMGYYAALKRPIAIIAESDSHGLNLMLTCTASTVVVGDKALQEFLSASKTQRWTTLVKEWTGANL